MSRREGGRGEGKREVRREGGVGRVGGKEMEGEREDRRQRESENERDKDIYVRVCSYTLL